MSDKNQYLQLADFGKRSRPKKTLEDRNECRNKVDLLRSRINLLTGKDQLLMTMYLDNGNSFRQMAQLAGVTQTSIARKIRRIAKRLTDNEYLICLRNPALFTTEQMTIAKEHFLQGLPMTKIAAKRRCSYYGVRQTIINIKQLIKNINSSRRRPLPQRR